MTSFTFENKSSRDIRRLRLHLNLSQRALADLLGVNQATVSRWERGDHPVDPAAQSRIMHLCKSHGVPTKKEGLPWDLNVDEHWPWLLRFYRASRALSQEQLAEIIGRSVDSVSRWERGCFTPDFGAQFKLRDLILAPLETDTVLEKMRARIEPSAGLYNLNWGNLVLSTSHGLRHESARRGYRSPHLARLDQMHDGVYCEWVSKRLDAGFLRGEVLLSYGFFRLREDDTRLMYSLPVTTEAGARMTLVAHLPYDFPPEKGGHIHIIQSDNSVS